jgi:hypothetical protein
MSRRDYRLVTRTLAKLIIALAQFAEIQLQVRLGWQREKPGYAAKNPFAVMTRHLFARITPDKALKKIGPA